MLERTWEEQREEGAGWEETNHHLLTDGQGSARQNQLGTHCLGGLQDWREAGSHVCVCVCGGAFSKPTVPDPLATKKPGHSPQLCLPFSYCFVTHPLILVLP